MQWSIDKFLTTHTGSLPRPDDLVRMMYAKEEGVPVEARGARGAYPFGRCRSREQAG